MSFEPESNALSERRGATVTGIHLRGDAVEMVVIKPEGKYRADGFAGKALSTVRGVEHPPNLRLAVFLICEPQCDVSDRGDVMLNDQCKCSSLSIEVSL